MLWIQFRWYNKLGISNSNENKFRDWIENISFLDSIYRKNLIRFYQVFIDYAYKHDKIGMGVYLRNLYINYDSFNKMKTIDDQFG